MFTDTSFSLFDWLQMEDIYSNIFVLKCNRYNEKVSPFKSFITWKFEFNEYIFVT